MNTELYKLFRTFLEQEKVEYIEYSHGKVHTAEQSNNLSGINLGEGIKTLAIRAKDQIAIITLRDDERLNFSIVKKIIGNKAKFMKENDIIETLKTEIGGLCPFGYKRVNTNNPLLLISKNALSLDSLEINPGRNDRTIVLNGKDFRHLLAKSNAFLLNSDSSICSISELNKSLI